MTFTLRNQFDVHANPMMLMVNSPLVLAEYECLDDTDLDDASPLAAQADDEEEAATPGTFPGALVSVLDPNGEHGLARMRRGAVAVRERTLRWPRRHGTRGVQQDWTFWMQLWMRDLP